MNISHLQGRQGDNEPNQVSQLDVSADITWKIKQSQSIHSERHLPRELANECTSPLLISALNSGFVNPCREQLPEISVKKKHDDIPITMIKRCERDILRTIFGRYAPTHCSDQVLKKVVVC